MNATMDWFETLPDGRLLCTLCPRACKLHDGDRGFCFVRKREGARINLDTYGKSTGFCIDPIEKKPLNHFLPGTSVLSFGTAGCNLGCKFCQNWDISKSREVARLSDSASPKAIASAAAEHGCRSVAFTYNDPVIWAEYAIDTAVECRRQGLKSVAVTAGYIMPDARKEFFKHMDAANIDLKAFTEDFYYKVTSSHLQPVLDTIEYVCNETNCWVELTNLIIPNSNDSEEEFSRMCDWILKTIGANVPIHFTAFHPDFRMTDRERTPHETLIKAYDIARSIGLNFVYVGNVHDVARQSTYCYQCGQLLIERDWYQLGAYQLQHDVCSGCHAKIPGVFEANPGNWGQKRQVIQISQTRPPMAQPLVTPDNTGMESKHLDIVHQAACQFVAAAVQKSSSDEAFDTLGELAQQQINGVYVTLKRGETLRGCCGWIGQSTALGQGLADAAFRTARKDPRMPPATIVELPYLDVSVTILGPSSPIDLKNNRPNKLIEIGQHGLRIQSGNKAGLLLPSVAVEHGMDAEQFLDALCRKAGLPAGSWLNQGTIVERFEGKVITKPMACKLDSHDDQAALSDGEVASMQRWVKANLLALQQGATPSYYASEFSDIDVLGVGIGLSHAGSQHTAFKLSLLHAMPLQSSLFELTQQFAAGRLTTDEDNLAAVVFCAAAHHGSVMHHDLRGVSTKRRAILATDGKSWSVGFDSRMTESSLLQEVVSKENFRESSTQVYSLRCVGTASPFFASTSPKADRDFVDRQGAVAGTFYPADDAERRALVDSFIRELGIVPKEPAAAIMVPHAGLRFSGKLATNVWSRVNIPKDVLIIGPKHTNDGVDWAVAPHTAWRISQTSKFSGAIELAKQIADNVSGMQLDAAAHRREHGIEVQLPILDRLAPDCRITAIAMHGGDVRELQRTANQLAELLSQLAEPPLLVISSDMNHFAPDEENRRRDRMALDAMRTLDPERLLYVCESNNISMCGLRPAVLVMMTLQALGKSMSYREIGYATSAEVSRDRSRVVGYAGILL